MAPGGGFSGHGVDKLGNFVMEGSPLLDRGAGETWWVWFCVVPWVVLKIVGTWLPNDKFKRFSPASTLDRGQTSKTHKDCFQRISSVKDEASSKRKQRRQEPSGFTSIRTARPNTTLPFSKPASIEKGGALVLPQSVFRRTLGGWAATEIYRWDQSRSCSPLVVPPF